MQLKDILKLPIDQQITELKRKPYDLPEYEILKSQWNPAEHDVMSQSKRPDKRTRRDTGQKDTSGKAIYETINESVNRISVPFQQIIVNRAVGFLLGNPVKIKKYTDNDAQELLSEMVIKTLDDNKIDFFNHRIARTVMSQCEAAELWYHVEDPIFWQVRTKAKAKGQFKLRSMLLSPENGDGLYPYFDEYGDMIAFSRTYKITDGNKDIEHMDTYTGQWIIKRTRTDAGWTDETIANPYGKIPVIYYSQPEPEWETVQSLIDRFENKFSNFGDTNDYFGSPMVKVTGKIISLPGKTSSGKVLQLDSGASAEYLSWSQSPESERLEFDLLRTMIYAMTQTPNISFDEMKSLGNDMSGFAIKLLFTDAHLKVENKIELFGEMFTRRLNLLKHIIGTKINISLASEVNTLYMEPVFSPYLPKNTKEEIDILATARGNKALISNETAIENNPLVGEVSEEVERMKRESDADFERMQREFNGTFNPEI